MQKLIVANWKSHKSNTQAQEWLSSYKSSSFQAEVVVAPAFSLLATMNWHISQQNLDLSLGVQDLSPFPAGAYTGAISSENVEGLNIKYVILGHSERRKYFHETHSEIANKVTQAIEAGITPIVCVDEEYIRLQASAIREDFYAKCVVSYEPVEAIGSGHNQPVAEVEPVIKQIKQVFGNIRVIYGGSVSGANASEYFRVSDGALVGTKSLDVNEFTKIVTAA